MTRYLVGLGLVLVFLVACTAPFGPVQPPGIAWAPGSFDSNGERIYFTATNDRGEQIPYRGGPDVGMMMMGQTYACASCHGPDARGGLHVMHMETMDAPDIRWSALAAMAAEEEGVPPGQASYDLAAFRLAVVEGQHPDGDTLSDDMPRWNIDERDLADLADYLQSLP